MTRSLDVSSSKSKVTLASLTKVAASAIRQATHKPKAKGKVVHAKSSAKPGKSKTSTKGNGVSSIASYRGAFIKALRKLSSAPLDKVSVPLTAFTSALAKFSNASGKSYTPDQAHKYGSLDDTAYKAGKIKFTPYGVTKYTNY